jgi:hypothetical protein
MGAGVHVAVDAVVAAGGTATKNRSLRILIVTARPGRFGQKLKV